VIALSECRYVILMTLFHPLHSYVHIKFEVLNDKTTRLRELRDSLKLGILEYKSLVESMKKEGNQLATDMQSCEDVINHVLLEASKEELGADETTKTFYVTGTALIIFRTSHTYQANALFYSI
jgi:hypothetical protein